jgi:hypothetical protein
MDETIRPVTAGFNRSLSIAPPPSSTKSAEIRLNWGGLAELVDLEQDNSGRDECVSRLIAGSIGCRNLDCVEHCREQGDKKRPEISQDLA